MWQWVGRLKLAEQDAGDLIQDVFLVLYKELPRFKYDPQRSFRAWLWTILKRRALDQKRRRQPVSLDSNISLVAPDLPLLDDAEYRASLTARALEIVRSEFSDQTWGAFWEHFINGRPVADVATELGLAPGSVYVAKGRVLRLLKERLSDFLD